MSYMDQFSYFRDRIMKEPVSFFPQGHRFPFGDIPIVTSKLLRPVLRQVNFPKSKKKRIRRKWEKDQRNWKLAEPIYYTNGRLIAGCIEAVEAAIKSSKSK